MVGRKQMSREGYEELRRKLEHMKTVELPRLERALGAARQYGDVSDSAEFDAARSEIWILERRIAELEDDLVNAEVIEMPKGIPDRVVFGARVILKDLETEEVKTFRLVGEGETAFFEDGVSVGSPLGRAIIGRKVGERFEVKVPAGLMKYEVLEISGGN